MGKKKPTKKKTAKKRPERPMSRGFGHLTIRPSWRVTGGATVDGEGDQRIPSQKCWEDAEWYE